MDSFRFLFSKRYLPLAFVALSVVFLVLADIQLFSPRISSFATLFIVFAAIFSLTGLATALLMRRHKT